MSRNQLGRRALTAATIGLGVAVASYATYAAVTWLRYGESTRRTADEEDALLDRFMPVYEVVERHHVHIAAPAAITFAAAKDQDLLRLLPVRTIVRLREIALGAAPDRRPRARTLLAETLGMGWGVLAEVPDREVVVGAVTKPWEPNVVFHALPPEQFASFNEPGFVKIAWTLRADPVDAGSSVFRTETRTMTTDQVARTKFRRYWSFVSPGVVLIRRLSLSPLKREAERRALAGLYEYPPRQVSSGFGPRKNLPLHEIVPVPICRGDV